MHVLEYNRHELKRRPVDALSHIQRAFGEQEFERGRLDRNPEHRRSNHRPNRQWLRRVAQKS